MKNKKLKSAVLSETVNKIVRAEELKARAEFAAKSDERELRAFFGAPVGGLSERGVIENRQKYGSNLLPSAKKKGTFARLLAAFADPFTAILFVLAAVSLFTDVIFAADGEKNYVTVIVIVTLIVLSGALRFVQETRSGNAAAKLAAMITCTATVQRNGADRSEIPVGEIVAGDTVFLSAGDMIPADMRILSAKDLFVSASALTGESAPVEKKAEPAKEYTNAVNCDCLALMGTSVVSGSGAGVVIAVGGDTVLGKTARSLSATRGKTAFDREVDSVSRLLILFMLVMVPVVFLVNGFTKGDWAGAALFAVSVAVGLTPEMLPMIVTACLAKGAVTLSGKKVIVKELNGIQNLGAADVFCTDKTGTLTQDKVVLEYHLNVNGEEDARVLRHAFLNSNYQTGLKNLMDAAVISRTRELCDAGEMDGAVFHSYVKTDEIPFDFSRRRMSVAVRDKTGKTQLITKGAVEEMLKISSYAELNGSICPLSEEKKKFVLQKADELNAKGMRVIAVAQKNLSDKASPLSVGDEAEMVLIGYLAFLDPPKSSSAAAIASLKKMGVAVKVLTGDNEKVTACVCRKVGLDCGRILLGDDLDGMNDRALGEAAETVTVFAKLSPAQKERVIRVLRENGHTVGYMGDGINDAPAMRAADVGISVDTAADIAKEAAGIILLEKDLTVVADGVAEGRRTCANMAKYIKITASSNFGNMLSVLVAGAFLPFLPMQAVQLVVLNLIYDVSCTALPWDRVDDLYLRSPSSWNAGSVRGFMFRFGPVSSLFDIATYAFLYFVFCPAVCGMPYAALSPELRPLFVGIFQAGWFIESALTQTAVIHTLRSDGLPVVKSRASLPVSLFTAAGVTVAAVLAFTPVGSGIGLSRLPVRYFGYLAAVLLLYMFLSEVAKRLYIRKYGRLL